MNTLYFIRHAESEANKARVLASRLPIPLTPEGKADADLIASELKEIVNLDRIISSPLKRAAQTAESFSEAYGMDVEYDERIAEHHMGCYTGMSYDDVKNEPGYETDATKRWSWQPEGGESYRMIAERITSFLSEINSKYTDTNLLIVTHGIALRLIIAALKNTLPEYPGIVPNNGEIMKVEFEGLGRVYEYETIHLGNSLSFAHNP